MLEYTGKKLGLENLHFSISNSYKYCRDLKSGRVFRASILVLIIIWAAAAIAIVAVYLA
jgi:hypothetical protein